MKKSDELSSIINHLENLVYYIENYEKGKNILIKARNKAKAKHETDRVNQYDVQIELHNIKINDYKEKYNIAIDKLITTKYEGIKND